MPTKATEQNKLNSPKPKLLLSDRANSITSHFHDLDFHNTPEIQPAILHPFLGLGDFGNISGPPGCGKTLIAADIILAAIHPDRKGIALGGLLRFNQDLFKYQKIAILDAENSPPRWESILFRKMKMEGLDPNIIRRKIVHIRSFDIGLQRASDWGKNSTALAEALYLNQVKFVIGDTLAGIWAPEDVNSSGWVHHGYIPFRSTCQRLGITCLMLTHTKRDNPRATSPVGPIGSSAQEGQADAQIMVSRTKNPDPPGIVLTHRKSRRSIWIQQGASVKALFTPQEGYKPQGNWENEWPHECPDLNAHLKSDPQTTQFNILEYLKQHYSSAHSSKDIANSTGVKDRTVRYHLKKLKCQLEVEMIGSGAAIKWKASP